MSVEELLSGDVSSSADAAALGFPGSFYWWVPEAAAQMQKARNQHGVHPTVHTHTRIHAKPCVSYAVLEILI